jgi:hypothetical protein
MEPVPIPEPAGFSDLSKADQIRYLQALWDRIAERPSESVHESFGEDAFRVQLRRI